VNILDQGSTGRLVQVAVDNQAEEGSHPVEGRPLEVLHMEGNSFL